MPEVTLEPSLRVDPPSDVTPRAVALVLPGGKAQSAAPTGDLQLAVLRMAPFAAALRQAGAADGLIVARLRYRVRGWNGAQESSAQDARWALDQLADQFPGRPIGLVGHSLGGRTAMRVADHPAVDTVAGLAPWLPPGESVAGLAGRAVLIMHGTDDRITDPHESARFAHRAERVARQVTYISVRDGKHAMLRRPTLWHDLAAGWTVGALGLSARPPRGRDHVVQDAQRRALAGESALTV
jgi:dienelactone hydrolase